MQLDQIFDERQAEAYAAVPFGALIVTEISSRRFTTERC